MRVKFKCRQSVGGYIVKVPGKRRKFDSCQSMFQFSKIRTSVHRRLSLKGLKWSLENAEKMCQVSQDFRILALFPDLRYSTFLSFRRGMLNLSTFSGLVLWGFYHIRLGWGNERGLGRQYSHLEVWNTQNYLQMQMYAFISWKIKFAELNFNLIKPVTRYHSKTFCENERI